MRIRIALPAFLLTLAAGCDDTLTVEPANEVPSGTAISDAASARSALAGAYDALQDDVDAEYRYYSGDFLFFGDLPSDNSTHTGTFDTFLAADQNRITADNLTIEAIWEVIYAAIGRTNGIIAKVPNVADLSDEERNEIIGEAHFLRALHYHNLVKLWGGVPLQLEPVETADDATNVTKASTDEVYAQVLSDLDQAETLMTSQGQTTKASRGAVFALRSRVLLYRQDWAGVISAADSAEGYGYSLAPQYSDLFTEQGSDTPEDIFKTAFTNTEANTIGYYYFSFNAGGRGEVAPDVSLIQAYDPDFDPEAVETYDPIDLRGQRNIAFDDVSGPVAAYGAKIPTAIGAEDIHVIRFAEVILNRAEAYARLGQLGDAVDDYNLIRERAGLAPHVLGVDVTTQDEVIDAILNERRLELAFEGDRWPDLVRTGRAAAVLGLTPDQEYQLLFPIPQNETDISGIEQNPGY